MVGHLSSDAVAGRIDYVFRTKTPQAGSNLRAYAPGGQALFTITPPTADIQDLISVTDLDGDGNSEIVAIYRGSATTAPVLWIFNGNGSTRSQYGFPTGLAIGRSTIRIYDVYPFTGQKRIVVAPDTFQYGYQNSNTSSKIYFFNSSGTLIASPSVPKSNGGDLLGSCAALVDNIDSVGASEIVVVAKSRIMVFNQDGGKLYYRQFVQPSASFTNYNNPDYAPDGILIWEGRRYGTYTLINIDGDGDLELVMAAGANPINYTNAAGAVYEAYPLYATSQADGYQPRIWQTWLQKAGIAYAPSNIPEPYKVGVGLSNVGDLNGDSIPEIVVTEYITGGPGIRFIDARNGSYTGPLISGICIGTINTDSAGMTDLIVYDPLYQTHSFWRLASNYTVYKVSESGMPFSGAITLQSRINDLPNVSEVGAHFLQTVTRSGGVKAVVGYTSSAFVNNNPNLGLVCPIGLATWTANGGTAQRSLNMATRPGLLLDVLKVTSNSDRTWIINLESACGSTTSNVRTSVQSGSTLVANGDL